MGYKITTNWLTNLACNKTRKLVYQQAVLAYADDTTWIVRLKDEFQKIINISSEFYEINDIEINSKKSELVVVNTIKKGKEKETLVIIVGKN